MTSPRPLAIVTGAAHRLGRVFALHLARCGYAILLHYHHSEVDALQTKAELEALDVPVLLAQADLTEPSAPEAIFAVVDASPHPLRVLVNSAALMPRGDVHSLSAEAWDATFALNLRAPFLMAQQASKRMASGGLIVNISDVGAQKAWTGFPAYTVSKAGLESLTRILAKALAPNIRVNAIAPGLVFPSDDMPADAWQRLTGRMPLQRTADPAELGAALEFLLENEYITGQTITVDGGYSLV